MSDTGRAPRPAEWTSADYVESWTNTDAMGDVLALPRRLSAALVSDAGIEVRHVVDLGAGAGAYLAALLETFHESTGTWIDVSAPMLLQARGALSSFGDRVRFELVDLRDVPSLPFGESDVIASSRVIHHFDAPTIRAIYARARSSLRPGGFLFNLDHFRSPGDWEARYQRVRERLVPGRGEAGPHSHDAPPQPLSDHLAWLVEAGFEPPDVPWRFLRTALLAARAPGP